MKTIKCPYCRGEGNIQVYPYYTSKMPKKVSIKCKHCNGHGELLVIPDDAAIIRESESKQIGEYFSESTIIH
jgi:DnaJ-class molecular chaperone